MCFGAFAQDENTYRFTSAEIEAIFLQQNLQLIAERMNISLADAEIVQAKLWKNPTLEISDVNLWSTKSQRDGESFPPLFGSFGRNTQFSVELSQLIQTANKRGKLVARERVSKEIAIQEFEVVLQGLKLELRKSISEISYLQNYLVVLDKQEEAINKLVESYKRQVQKGNIAKAELFRLQSSLLEVENESNETKVDLNEQIKTLKALLSIDPLVNIKIVGKQSRLVEPDALSLPVLLLQTIDHKADVKLSRLQTKLADKSLAYEKSQRAPDVTVSANYDRFGGIWKDFIGFGVSIDLPVFNRNQGGIKAARITQTQSQYLERQQINEAQHEVVEAYNNYLQAYNFHDKVCANDFITELDDMLEAYSKNLLNRNISMLEYIDFVESYQSTKQTVLEAQKNMQIQFEELQYRIGKDLNLAL
jgi:outer membrane protein, heavy metal efflux system